MLTLHLKSPSHSNSLTMIFRMKKKWECRIDQTRALSKTNYSAFSPRMQNHTKENAELHRTYILHDIGIRNEPKEVSLKKYYVSVLNEQQMKNSENKTKQTPSGVKKKSKHANRYYRSFKLAASSWRQTAAGANTHDHYLQDDSISVVPILSTFFQFA